jgi:hypothetical protein
VLKTGALAATSAGVQAHPAALMPLTFANVRHLFFDTMHIRPTAR